MFIHLEPETFLEPVQENRETGRVYITPKGSVYPSVTTVLGVGDNEWLEEWKRKVGPEEAQLTSSRAAARGTRIHKMCEAVLDNKEVEPSMFDQDIFNSIRKALPRINNIRCNERRLFSDILRTAGTVDLIADFDNEPAIIDWKTSGRIKYREDITSYFAQAAAYSVAYEERTGVKIPNIVIVMGVDHEPEPLVFIEKAKDWVPEFIKFRKIFRLLKGY